MAYKQKVSICDPLRGYCTPNQKLACFVLYLKIILIIFQTGVKTPVWKIIYASFSKLSKELKNSITILVGQADL